MDLEFTIKVEADEEGWSELMGTSFTETAVAAYLARQFEAEMDAGLTNYVHVYFRGALLTEPEI